MCRELIDNGFKPVFGSSILFVKGNQIGFESCGAVTIEKRIDSLYSKNTEISIFRSGGACQRVHAFCNNMEGATKKEVLEACIADGINVSTARTQYAKWSKNK